MANFRKYDKVHRWDHEDEITGINVGTVYIQEKIDGANAQVCQGDDGYLYVASKNRNLARAKNEDKWPFEIMDGFRGFPQYTFEDKRIRKFFEETKDKYILYGEWLVKHTVNYPAAFTNRFWIFDVYDREEHKYIEFPDYYAWLAIEYGLDVINTIGNIINPSMDQLLDMVRNEKEIPKSMFGAETIEGLVFKNYQFKNGYGRTVYMKAVTKDFHEVHHAIMGTNRYDSPEVYVVSKYQTVPRMEKVYQKMIDEVTGSESGLEMRNIPEFLNRVLHDFFTEEAWNMFMRDKRVSKKSFNMLAIRKVSMAKSKNWFIGKLQQRLTGEKQDATLLESYNRDQDKGQEG